jgi:7,8-dihydropterin-6-yl-methyl-4-(beta-D-ribofuranosyl)aminobenzene 5'-phosphate synthase
MKITILTENNSRIDNYLLAEPGLSLFIEVYNKKILFDTGYSDVFLQNAKKLEIDLSQITDIVISHGHNDHTRGLQFLNLDNKNITFIAHPNIFDTKVDENKVHYGCPITKEELAKKYELNLTKNPYWISENLCFLGEIENNKSIDIDDSALVYKSKKGLIIITGCSHSGIINILNYAKKVTSVDKIYAILGGFHLLSESKAKIGEIAEVFKKEQIKYLAPCHCCDLKSKIILSKYLSIEEICTGDTIELD